MVELRDDILDQVKGTTNAFNSSKIPNEILDIMFVRTDMLKKYPELGKALTGAWYETIGLVKANDQKALTAMAKKSGTSLDSYNRQLKTTYMYWSSADAATFTKSKKMIEVMDLVRKFSFDHKLWTNAKSVDDVGISFPDSTVLGKKDNIKLRFTDEYMKMAADGKL